MKRILLGLFCSLFFGFFWACDPNEGPPEPPTPAAKVEITVIVNITYHGGWGLNTASILIHTQDAPINSYGGMVYFGTVGSSPSQIHRKFVFEGEDAFKVIGRQVKGFNYLTFKYGWQISGAYQFESEIFTIVEGVNPDVVITAVQ
jgi:hypothetical protein